MLKILLFNEQLCEITKCRYTGAPASYSAVHGKYGKNTRELTLHLSLWGTFYISVAAESKTCPEWKVWQKIGGLPFLSVCFLCK